MDVALRSRHVRVLGNPHDREGIDAGLPQPGQHRVPEAVNHEVRWESKGLPYLHVLVVERADEEGRVALSREEKARRRNVLTLDEKRLCSGRQANGPPSIP